ncbi:MAG: cytochrome c maturation protein CcmE [Rhodospirillales bacterium]|nr:cytochrome c maturation protein CcmE [Rhodospirillales bacterium]
MTRKRRRFYFLISCMITLCIAAALVLTAIEDKITFFYSPTDLVLKKNMPRAQQIRIGGLVKRDSWKKPFNGLTHKFIITDLQYDILVSFKGIIPDIFREGQGVVVLGRLTENGVFQASEVLAKHDERYMPPEVADALKQSGKWEGNKVKQ